MSLASPYEIIKCKQEVTKCDKFLQNALISVPNCRQGFGTKDSLCFRQKKKACFV